MDFKDCITKEIFTEIWEMGYHAKCAGRIGIGTTIKEDFDKFHSYKLPAQPVVMEGDSQHSGERICQFCGEKIDFDTIMHVIGGWTNKRDPIYYYEYTHWCKSGIIIIAKGKTKQDVIDKLLRKSEP